jgi:hypothetical protein
MFGYIYYSVARSVENMFTNQPDLAVYSDQTNEHEPNLSFHLANEVWKYFSWLSCDFDVIKPHQGSQRPDIIFHKRGISDYNHLVLEVKRRSNDEVKNWRCGSDERKICNYWFQGELHYEFGISIIIDERTKEFTFTLFQHEHQRTATFPLTKVTIQNQVGEIEAIIEEIKSRKKADINADTSALENEIDRLVFS